MHALVTSRAGVVADDSIVATYCVTVFLAGLASGHHDNELIN